MSSARADRKSGRLLDGLFAPRSVAVVGASATPGKWGYEYSRQLLAHRDRRAVYLVNARGEPVLGETTYRSLRDLPEVPDLAVICVPAERVADVVADGTAIGTPFYVCVTAGFAETGESGRAVEGRLVDKVRASGARLVGPNCVGIFDAAAALHCTAFWDLPAGDIGLISQSGGIIVELGIRLPRIGMGLSRAVSVGNQADLDVADFVDIFAEDSNTRLIAAYVEDFRDGRRLLRAIDGARLAGKDVVLVAPQQSAAVARAVSSHTGSLVSDEDIVVAACEDLGIIRVRSLGDLMLAVQGLSAPHRASGRRVAVVADGGGSATLGTDAAIGEGFDVPAFSAELAEAIRRAATPGSAVSNPVDLVGALDLSVFVPVVEAIARSGEVDAVLLNGAFNNVGMVDVEQESRVARALVEAAGASGIALAGGIMLPEEPAIRTLANARIPVFDFPTQAARAMSLARLRAGSRPVPQATGSKPLRESLGYFGARAALSAYGVAFTNAREVRSRAEAMAAAAALGYPVVLKGLGTSHKSDAGAVILNIRDDAELCHRFDGLVSRLNPPSFSVEAMVTHRGVEVLVGGLRDRSFGPTVTVAAGGTLTELLKDRRVALAPVDRAYAEGMLRDLKTSPRLFGFRGAPPVDLAALADAVVAVSRFVADHSDVGEVEINPIIAHAEGATAVDARIAPASHDERLRLAVGLKPIPTPVATGT